MYQNRPSKYYQSPFDLGFQIVITPRSLASVPEPIGMPSNVIFHQCNPNELTGFVVYYVNNHGCCLPGNKVSKLLTMI
jgi:hypothetical protein